VYIKEKAYYCLALRPPLYNCHKVYLVFLVDFWLEITKII